MFTGYHPASGRYVTIPKASMICVVETPGELKRLYDEIWEVVERGRWIKE